MAFVALEAEVTAEHAEAGAAEADHRGGEAAAVQAGGERQEDVLRALDGGAQVATGSPVPPPWRRR
ncbi:hypothetical protein GCM10017687_45010 [Streptomyces echinatus]